MYILHMYMFAPSGLEACVTIMIVLICMLTCKWQSRLRCYSE